MLIKSLTKYETEIKELIATRKIEDEKEKCKNEDKICYKIHRTKNVKSYNLIIQLSNLKNNLMKWKEWQKLFQNKDQIHGNTI